MRLTPNAPWILAGVGLAVSSLIAATGCKDEPTVARAPRALGALAAAGLEGR